VVFYRMAPGRGADVPKAHFAKLRKDLVDVVLVCDRYSAYKCLAKDKNDLILAYCWVHVRRDFPHSIAFSGNAQRLRGSLAIRQVFPHCGSSAAPTI
jgi:hypothetical protein